MITFPFTRTDYEIKCLKKGTHNDIFWSYWWKREGKAPVATETDVTNN